MCVCVCVRARARVCVCDSGSQQAMHGGGVGGSSAVAAVAGV